MEFTVLEKAVLDWMAQHSQVPNLARQLAACHQLERELTGVGAFTKLAVPRDLPPIDRMKIGSPISGPWIEATTGVQYGGSSLLFLDDTGYATELEIAIAGEDFDAFVSTFKLSK